MLMKSYLYYISPLSPSKTTMQYKLYRLAKPISMKVDFTHTTSQPAAALPIPSVVCRSLQSWTLSYGYWEYYRFNLYDILYVGVHPDLFYLAFWPLFDMRSLSLIEPRKPSFEKPMESKLICNGCSATSQILQYLNPQL